MGYEYSFKPPLTIGYRWVIIYPFIYLYIHAIISSLAKCAPIIKYGQNDRKRQFTYLIPPRSKQRFKLSNQAKIETDSVRCRWYCNDNYNCDINNEGDNDDDDSIHNHVNDNSDNYSDDGCDFVIIGLGIFAFMIFYRLEIVKQ